MRFNRTKIVPRPPRFPELKAGVTLTPPVAYFKPQQGAAMLDALKEDLSNGCKARLRKAELKAEDRLRTEIRHHFRKLTPEALEASQPGDHKKLIPFIEQYSESVVRAWKQEVIPLVSKEGEYLDKIEAVVKALVDEMTPEKIKLIWSYDQGLTTAPSGYWEETLLHCWHVLEGKSQVTDTWSVRNAFDSNYRWTLRLRKNTKPFRRHLLTHLLKQQMSSWKGMWWEHRAQKESEADSGPSPDQDSSEKEQAVAIKKPEARCGRSTGRS